MFYYQLQLTKFTAHPDTLSDQLIELGALAVTLEDDADQPIFEPAPNTAPVWQHTKLTGLFSEATIRQNVLAILQKNDPALIYKLEAIAEQNWERAWMDRFHPLKFGERTWVCPSWCVPPQPKAITILLDPGLAFGTGMHPTTALCLEWIDSAELCNKIVIDYGCGSGILAIAALLHGARHVYAIDYDPQALQATRDNAERNKIASERLTVLSPDAIALPLNADVLFANILAEPLTTLAATFFNYLKANGAIILSGILPKQTADVSRAYEAAGFMDIVSLEKSGWIRLLAHRV